MNLKYLYVHFLKQREQKNRNSNVLCRFNATQDKYNLSQGRQLRFISATYFYTKRTLCHDVKELYTL